VDEVELDHGKKIAGMLRKLRGARGLSEDERHLFARSLAATSGRAMALPRKLSPLARLIHVLQQEKIRFQIVGMSAAILRALSFREAP
jgi:hypothetical protein